MTKNEQLEYMDYLRGQGFSDSDARDYMKEALSAAGSAASTADSWLERSHGPIPGAYKVVKHGIAPALDYVASLGRGAVAGAGQAATGTNLGINFGDVVKGKTPASEELMRRGGYPNGVLGEVNVPVGGGKTALLNLAQDLYKKLPGDTRRKLEGFVADAAMDPTNLIPAAGLYKEAKAGVNGAQSINAVGSGSGLLDTLLRPVSKTAEAAGSASWRNGLKDVDRVVARYGKDPVSDVLMREGVAGNERQIYNQMNTLGEKRLGERNAILSAADAAGAEADVPASLKPAQNFIEGVKAKGDPTLNQLVESMQKKVDLLGTTAAKPAVPSAPEIRMTSLEPTLMELPVSVTQAPLDPTTRTLESFKQVPGELGYDAPTMSVRRPDGKASLYTREAGANTRGQGIVGEPVVNNPVDDILNLPRAGQYSQVRPAPYELAHDFREVVLQPARPASPRVPGPTATQMSAMKTNSASSVGDAGYQVARQTPIWGEFEKALAAGQRQSTEAAVSHALGDEAGATLAQKNDELGRILTSKQMQEKAAEKADAKNLFSSVDAMIAARDVERGSGLMSLLKKSADFAKTSRARTVGGKALVEASQNVPESAWKQLLLSPDDRDGRN